MRVPHLGLSTRLRGGRIAELKQLRRRVNRLHNRLENVETDLEARVIEVEEGLQEQRGLSYRVAALSDLVAELVETAARADPEGLKTALDRYRREI